MKFYAFVLAAIAAVLSSHAPAAHAAEVIVIQTDKYDELSNLSIDVDIGLGFNLGPDGDIRCNYVMDGGIEKGDLERLKKAIPSFEDRKSDQTPRLCLNSPGGDYPEGLAISKWLMQENIGTAVPANAKCYSSCSLIFMGGTYPWKGELNRFLHVTGDVGFHAPYFKMDSDEAFNKDHIAEAYSLGVGGIRELMTLGVGNKVQRFPPELMAEMLAKGPNEVFSIDTVGKAIRFRVHLYGAKAGTPLDKSSFCNACINMNYGAAESYGKGGENDICATDAEIQQKAFPNGKRLISDLAPRAGQCAIDVESKDGIITGWTWVDAEADWKDGLELAHWYLSPPNTNIAALHDGKPDASMEKPDGSRLEIKPTEQGRDIAAELEDFIRNRYLGHGKTGHAVEAAMFAEEVDYYNHGRLAREAVMQDHQAYYAKWPSRTYQMIAESLGLKVIDDNTVEVSFRHAFQVQNDKKKIGGISASELTIILRDGKFVITREAGQVVSKN